MIRYLGDYLGVFDNEQLKLMSKALDHACAIAQEGTATYELGRDAERNRAALAKSIVAAAMGGEFDPRRLSEIARADLAAANMPLSKSSSGNTQGPIPGPS